MLIVKSVSSIKNNSISGMLYQMINSTHFDTIDRVEFMNDIIQISNIDKNQKSILSGLIIKRQKYCRENN